MRQVRDGSAAVTAYNEGLVVFLYDNANSSQILEARPSILEGFGEDDASDPALEMLARSGALVAAELQGDGELSIELVFGEPLDPAEPSQGRWSMPVDRARLHLPSGDLRIEGYNSSSTRTRWKVRKDRGVPFHRATTNSCSTAATFSLQGRTPPSDHAVQVVVLVPGGGPTAKVRSPMLRFPPRAADA